MAKTDIWMPLFIGDYLAQTTHLTTQQHGAYLLLMMTAWRMGGRLPNDDGQLAAICRMSVEEWEKSKRLLLAFFSVEDSFLIQEHLLAEYEKSQRVRAAKKSAGALGGRPKKQIESEEKPNGLAKEKQTETPSPSPSPSQEIQDQNLFDAQKTERPKKSKKKCALPSNFEFTEELDRAAREYWSRQNRFDLSSSNEFEKFVAYHTAHGTVMADWAAGWKTWYINATKFNQAPVGGFHAQTGNHRASAQERPRSAVDRVLANIARDRAQREAAAAGSGGHPVGADGAAVRPQVDERLRGPGGPGQHLGSVLEGDFSRTD